MSNTIKFATEEKQSALATLIPQLTISKFSVIDNLKNHKLVVLHNDADETIIDAMSANDIVKAFVKDIEFTIPEEMTLAELYKTYFYRPYVMINMVETVDKISTALTDILFMLSCFIRVYDDGSRHKRHFRLTAINTPANVSGLGISKSSMSLIPTSNEGFDYPHYDPRLSLEWRAIIHSIGFDNALKLNRNLFGKFEFTPTIGPNRKSFPIYTNIYSTRNNRTIDAINNAVGHECGEIVIREVVGFLGNSHSAISIKNLFFIKAPIYGRNSFSIDEIDAYISWPTTKEFSMD